MSEFNPGRIMMAVDLRGWTKKDLAIRCGSAPSQITRLCQGLIPFTDQWADRIAYETGLPVTFFILNDEETPAETLTFRRLAKMPKWKIGQIASEFGLLAGSVNRLKSMTSLRNDTVWLDALAPRSAPVPEDIERIASDVRTMWGLSAGQPIGDLTRNIEREGIFVVPLASPVDDKIGDGVTRPTLPAAKNIIGYFPEGKPGDRQRFTIAHELGHIILHRYRKPDDRKLAEQEAHDFAGALLLPGETAKHILSPRMTLDDYPYVKASWGMSVSSLINRAFRLGVIDSNRRKSLMIQLSTRHWNRHEPIEVADERPTLFTQLVGSGFGDLNDFIHPSVSKDSLQGFLGLPYDLVNHWCSDNLRIKEDRGIDSLLN